MTNMKVNMIAKKNMNRKMSHNPKKIKIFKIKSKKRVKMMIKMNTACFLENKLNNHNFKLKQNMSTELHQKNMNQSQLKILWFAVPFVTKSCHKLKCQTMQLLILCTNNLLKISISNLLQKLRNFLKLKSLK
jgi:hypothetical protein